MHRPPMTRKPGPPPGKGVVPKRKAPFDPKEQMLKAQMLRQMQRPEDDEEDPERMGR